MAASDSQPALNETQEVRYDPQAAGRGCAFTQRVALDQLPAIYRQIGSALIQAGFPPARSVDLLEASISIRCAQCGITITGKELVLAALSDAPRETHSPKVGRLVVGYCGRKGCNSYYCDLVFESVPGLDWPAMWHLAIKREEITPFTAHESVQSVQHCLLRSTADWLVQRYGAKNLMTAATVVLALIAFLYWTFRVPDYSRNPSGYKAVPGVKVIVE